MLCMYLHYGSCHDLMSTKRIQKIVPAKPTLVQQCGPSPLAIIPSSQSSSFTFRFEEA